MKPIIYLAVCLLLSSAQKPDTRLAPLLGNPAGDEVRGQYIVVFKEEVTAEQAQSHKDLLKEKAKGLGNSDFKIRHHYSIGKHFQGYAATMDAKILSDVRAQPEVKYVEHDQVAQTLQAQCVKQVDAPWNLVRTTVPDYPAVNPPKDYQYGKADGAGIEAYIIDSGIDITHPLFQGRAVQGVDFVDNPPPENRDPNGHGTNMAGIVVADTYGVARSATAISVRVLDKIGSGQYSRIIAGLSYVAQKKQSKPSRSMVACMALGGGLSPALNNATDACVRVGVHIAVAAGNSNKDSCNSSPASADLVMTTAASNREDRKPSFSDYGTCVDIIAPGDPITSLAPNNGTVTDVGTSQASAHVAGVIARVLSVTDEYNDPKAMKAFLKSIAAKDRIAGFPANPPTVNELLNFDDCA